MFWISRAIAGVCPDEHFPWIGLTLRVQERFRIERDIRGRLQNKPQTLCLLSIVHVIFPLFLYRNL